MPTDLGGRHPGGSTGPRPELAALTIADPPERWKALGFTVTADAVCLLGGVEVRLGGPGTGITGWTLRHAPAGVELDGLATTVTESGPPEPAEVEVEVKVAVDHPNGATGIDHVVISTGDFDRTVAACQRAGLELRRIRDAGGYRQGFRRLGPAIMEIVEIPARVERAAAGGARFWGLVVVVADLAGLARRLPEHLGEIRPAVQPGRRIATLAASAGLSAAVAFMDAEGPNVPRS